MVTEMRSSSIQLLVRLSCNIAHLVLQVFLAIQFGQLGVLLDYCLIVGYTTM